MTAIESVIAKSNANESDISNITAEQANNIISSHVKNVDELSATLKLVRATIRCPSWSMGIKNVKVTSRKADGEVGEVSGKITKPNFKYNVHPLFDELTNNELTIRRFVSSYTVADSEDDLRLISVYKEGEFLAQIAKLIFARQDIAKRLDDAWETEVVPTIAEKFGSDFDQMVRRLPRPSFVPKTEVLVTLRSPNLTSTDEIDWTNVDVESRKIAVDMTQGFIKRFAEDRAKCIIDGVLQPVLELAQKINGEAPNPKFDASKPEGKDNLRVLPPTLESGKRKGGCLDDMFTVLDRVLNFDQFIPQEIKEKIVAARSAVEQCGGDVTKLNGSMTIQRAIRTSFESLGSVVKSNVNKYGRGMRALEV